MSNQKYTIFDNIEGELRRNHKTQEDLTSALGVERKTYQNWKAKNDMPSSKFIETAVFLGCTLDVLSRGVF